MELRIEDLGAVKKKVHIEIPSKRVDSTFASVTNAYKQRASLPGFRRGKVPASHVRKLYGRQIDVDVTQRLVEVGYKRILEEESILPIGEPELDANPVKAGESYSFSMTFDVVPNIELKDHSTLAVEQVQWTASDDVVNTEIAQLLEHSVNYESDESKTTADDGDMVVIDYAGTVDGVAFDGGTAENAELVLGSGRFIPGFEEQIVGQALGASFDVTVKFPDEYPAENLKGKEAIFACTLNGIKTKVIPELNAEFAEKMGEESVESLRTKVKESIEERHNRQSKTEARTQLKTVLGQAYDFELPSNLVDGSLEDRRNQLKSSLIQEGVGEDELDAKLDERVNEVRDEVIDGLRAELVLDEIARQNEVDVTQQEVAAHIEEIAQTTGPYAAQIRQMYRDPGRRAGVARRMRLDKVLDFLLPQVNVTSETREIPANVDDE